MHHPATSSGEVGFLPAMYSFSGPISVPEFDFGPQSTSDHLQRATKSNNSWETRCHRKHKRRVDDEACSAKKRRLMSEAEVDISETSSTGHDWPKGDSSPAVSAQQEVLAPPQPFSVPPSFTVPQPSSALSQPETESSCMEIEAAQRKLQEIEDRSHSGMELVLWRPPEDPFCRRLKGSLQKQRKQQTACRQHPTPCPSPTPHSPLSPSSPPADTESPLYSFPVPRSSGEEDMEM
ncbi:coiled-coil domain-containing protein 117 isoform X3 [Odontesthes bonariensis]|uniref:coiled-coil domain-containing protein 117 isoform X3 n=1 Tax=Odontesthes bonariensis TaxID=219752 RepID=UPI003F58DFCC